MNQFQCMKIGFLKFFPKSQKSTPDPHGQNPRFEPKPDYPFTHEPKYIICFEIEPQIEVQIPKI